MQLTIKTPADFNFHRTVLSHGWCELLPFEIDRAKWKLTRVLDIDRAKPVTVEVSPRKGGMKIEVSRRVGQPAAAMAAKSSEFYRDKIRAGYRSAYLKELAQRVASGELDVESWLTSDASLSDLMKEIKSVKGVGNYAAENLLKLIGRYDGL